MVLYQSRSEGQASLANSLTLLPQRSANTPADLTSPYQQQASSAIRTMVALAGNPEYANSPTPSLQTLSTLSTPARVSPHVQSKLSQEAMYSYMGMRQPATDLQSCRSTAAVRGCCNRRSSLDFRYQQDPTPIITERMNIVNQVKIGDTHWELESAEIIVDIFGASAELACSDGQTTSSAPALVPRPGTQGYAAVSEVEKLRAASPLLNQDDPALDMPPPAVASSSSSHVPIPCDISQVSNFGALDLPAIQPSNWESRFEELKQYHQRHGHCLVSTCKYPSLSQWVKRQRYQLKIKLAGKHSPLTEDRIQALNGLGFIWNSHRLIWEQRYAELVEFHRQHGNCNVPTEYDRNPALGVWVKGQRRQYNLFRFGWKSSMTNERLDRLNALGMVWYLRRPKMTRRSQRR